MAGPTRQPIDVQALESYISLHLPDIKLPLQVRQFGFGQSNPTYQITASDGQKLVVRKKPPGKLLSKTAHRVDREYRIIHALRNTDVPVPETFLLCQNVDIIGTPFYIMEYLDGRIFEDPAMPGVADTERTAMWKDAIYTLGKLHCVRRDKVGLEDYGKPAGFYNRQINTFEQIARAQADTCDIETKQRVGQLPHIDEILGYFRNPKTQPRDRVTLVHGDYKIDNLVFHITEPRVIGILDWEISTVGHPLSDLVNVLMPYLLRGRLHVRRLPHFHEDSIPGLPCQEQLLKWYGEVVGWDASLDLPWGSAFGMLRSTFIFQGIAARFAMRQASSAHAKEIGEQRIPMGELVWEYVQEARKTSSLQQAKL